MLKYLKYLTEEELIRFEKFINSPYFNSNRNIIKLFSYLKDHKEFTGKEIPGKEDVFKFIYEEENYDDQKYRKLISDFTKLSEKFLMYAEFEKYIPGNRIMLLTSLRKKNLSKRFEAISKEVFEEQKKSFSKDDEYYLNQVTLEREFYNFYLNRFQNEFAECLQSKSDNLDLYFVFSKLHNFLEMFNNEHNKGDKSKFVKTYYDDTIAFVEKNKIAIQKNHPNLFIIFNALQMYVTSDNYYLKELTDYLKLNTKKFKKEKLKHYYNYLISFYTMQINKGKIEYRHPIFKIFEYMFKKDLFVIDNIITEQEFSTVINNSLALGKYEWVDKFIRSYKNNLDPKIADDTLNLTKAKIYFYKKDYENLFKYLNEVKYVDPGIYTNAKYLLARVHFDTGNIKSLGYLLQNLRQYLRSKENLTSEQISAVKIFVKSMFSLIKILEQNNYKKRRSDMLVLRKELDNTEKFVPVKQWFYEKLDEMK